MKRILLGQILLIICCILYLVWWYRGYRPGISVSRISGVNGALLFATAAFGVAGLICSLTRVQTRIEYKISPMLIVIGGIALYFALMLITRFAFQRIVTTELFLIVGWIMLEMTVINRLYAAEILTNGKFWIMCAVIALAFAVSIILYAAYYRMEEMRAFYAAMVPLITEAAAMAVLTVVIITGKTWIFLGWK